MILEDLKDKLPVNVDIKFEFCFIDKMFKPNEVVVYAQSHNCLGYEADEFEVYRVVITVDSNGRVRKYMKDVSPVPSGWSEHILHH